MDVWVGIVHSFFFVFVGVKQDLLSRIVFLQVKRPFWPSRSIINKFAHALNAVVIDILLKNRSINQVPTLIHLVI